MRTPTSWLLAILVLVLGMQAELRAQSGPGDCAKAKGGKSKSSPNGNTMVLYGAGTGTKVYRLIEGNCSLVAEYPFDTEDVTFNSTGSKLYLLHSKSFWSAQI